MEEIAQNIFIEQSYPGVVSSVLRLRHGLLMIDSPFLADDRQSWQQKLVNLGGGVSRLLVLLDSHMDRLLGVPLSELPILAHENVLQIIAGLPTPSRTLEKLSGSESDPYEMPQNGRGVLPNMTYSHQLRLYWDDQPVIVTHQPGGHSAGSWVRYDAQSVIFVGDSVVVNQPPFLACCDLDRWIDELTWLSSDYFRGYQVVSGRDGPVTQKSVVKMIEFLTMIKGVVTELKSLENWSEEVDRWVPEILRKFDFDGDKAEQNYNRLAWGLSKLLERMAARQDETEGELYAG